MAEVVRSYSTYKKNLDFERVELFSSPIYKVHVSEWKTNKTRILDLVDFNLDRHGKENFLPSFTDFYAYDRNGEYKTEFSKLINPYLNYFFKRSRFELERISWMWCQKYNRGEFHPPHDHGVKGLSAVFYADFDPSVHEGTSFISPAFDELGEKDNIKPKVIEGDLVIFPSNITHMSIPHQSDKPRVILSFNMDIRI